MTSRPIHPTTCEYCGLVTHTKTIGHDFEGEPIIEALRVSCADPFAGVGDILESTGRLVREDMICACTAEFKKLMKHHLEKYDHPLPRTERTALQKADDENLTLRFIIIMMVIIVGAAALVIWG